MNAALAPIDLVNALDVLKKKVDAETALRTAATEERQAGEPNGPMRAAHDQSIKKVVAAARAFLALAAPP
jgi:hypothetical protein